jgi:hypothetical protein
LIVHILMHVWWFLIMLLICISLIVSVFEHIICVLVHIGCYKINNRNLFLIIL